MQRPVLSACAGVLALSLAAGSALMPDGPVLAEAARPAQIDGRGVPTLAPVIEPVSDAVVNIAVVSERPAQLSPLFRDPFFAPFPPPMPPKARSSGR